jgi:type IV pilus assembly protein PilC
MNKFFQRFKLKISRPIQTDKPSRQYFMRISLQEQVLFIKRLATLIRAGVPLLTSLLMLQKQTKSKTMIKILDQVSKDVENGQYLATSLGRFRKIFGELTINIIEIGEVSGTLGENLDHLAMELKKKQILRRKVVSAAVYPIFIIFATFGITALLTVFVFPKILPIFKSVNFNLPWTTKALIFISNLLLHHGLLIILILVVLVIASWFLLQNKRVHYYYDRFLIAAPIIGQLTIGYNLANICRTLGLMLKSGVVIVRSAKITANTTTNLVYKQELNEIADKLFKGDLISGHLNVKPKFFPTIATQMVAVGESTGNLSDTFLYLADMYEDEVDDLTKNLSTIIEPVLLVLMGLMVGFVAISIITPIYGITQHLNPK